MDTRYCSEKECHFFFLIYFVKHELKGLLKCIGVKICTHSPPSQQIVTGVTRETSQTVTHIVLNMQLILYSDKVLKEKLISLWANWKALG